MNKKYIKNASKIYLKCIKNIFKMHQKSIPNTSTISSGQSVVGSIRNASNESKMNQKWIKNTLKYI